MGEKKGGWVDRKGAALVTALAIALGGTSLAGCSSRETPAASQPPGTNDPRVGFDVSYPQYGKPLPAYRAFGIVGLNGNIATTDNPALREQYAWAKQSTGTAKIPKVSFYVNTANPGNVVSAWPKSGTNKQGACDGSNSAACAYEYGRHIANADLKRLPHDAPGNAPIWLDVEKSQSWQTSTFTNRSVLVGMVDTLRAAGHATGVYSNASDWQLVVGQLPPTSGLYGIDIWIHGDVDTIDAAKTNCSAHSFTAGRIVLSQATMAGWDADYSCAG